MIINGMNQNPKGMSKEEKLGIVVGAVAFIVVLLFFLVLGNMSFETTQPVQPTQPSHPIETAPSVQPKQPVQQAQGVGMGELFIYVGGMLLLVALLYLARKSGWIYLEEVVHTNDESWPEAPQVRHEKVRKDHRGQQAVEVRKLTRELERRQETIQRLAGERNKASQEIQLLRETLALDEEVSLIDGVKQLQGKLATAVKAKKELTARLRDFDNFREVPVLELEEFWPTLVLDKKPFMSKRRQERLLARMRAENMKWMRVG